MTTRSNRRNSFLFPFFISIHHVGCGKVKNNGISITFIDCNRSCAALLSVMLGMLASPARICFEVSVLPPKPSMSIISFVANGVLSVLLKWWILRSRTKCLMSGASVTKYYKSSSEQVGIGTRTLVILPPLLLFILVMNASFAQFLFSKEWINMMVTVFK